MAWSCLLDRLLVGRRLGPGYRRVNSSQAAIDSGAQNVSHCPSEQTTVNANKHLALEGCQVS